MFKFYDFTPGADTWEWDFGDNAGISRERSPIHLYKKAGTYDVMLTINGTCSRFQTLTIIQGTPGFQEETAMDPNLITSADSSNTSQPDAMEEPGSDSDPSAQVATRLVRAPDPASTANQQVAATATNRRENVTRNPTSANQENNIKSQIPTRQESLVSQESTLTPQGDSPSESVNQQVAAEMTETVDKNLPRTEVGYIPNEPEPYQSSGPELADDGILTDLDIKTMVFDVSELRQLPSDVMNSFCKGSLDRTIIDANNTTMSMGDFFDRIEGKPIRIKSFIVHRDPTDNNCIVGMKIKYGKVGLF